MTVAAEKKISTSLLGAAAEHYVMCQLLRHGRLAALAPVGMPFADIIVSNHIGSALTAVQVKARTIGADGGWRMSAKHEKNAQPLVVYCFVEFGAELSSIPKCWVVPSIVVAQAISAGYQAWLAKPGKKGQPHKENEMRRFRPDYDDLGLADFSKGWLNRYSDAWDLIASQP